jgi:hypothetical protein
VRMVDLRLTCRPIHRFQVHVHAPCMSTDLSVPARLKLVCENESLSNSGHVLQGLHMRIRMQSCLQHMHAGNVVLCHNTWQVQLGFLTYMACLTAVYIDAKFGRRCVRVRYLPFSHMQMPRCSVLFASSAAGSNTAELMHRRLQNTIVSLLLYKTPCVTHKCLPQLPRPASTSSTACCLG